MRGRYIVFFIVALGVLVTAYLVIFKPGPMSAEKVAHAKQRAIFGEETRFRIQKTQLATMSDEQLDSTIALFNQVIRIDDSLRLFSNGPTLATAEVVQLRDKRSALLAYVDLLSDSLENRVLVDSLFLLASDAAYYTNEAAANSDPTANPLRDFDRIYQALYVDKQ
jgi:hypothetical protein